MCRAIRPIVSSSLFVVCQPRMIRATRMAVASAMMRSTPSTSGLSPRYFLFWPNADVRSSRRCCPSLLPSSTFSCFWIMLLSVSSLSRSLPCLFPHDNPSFNKTLSSLVCDPHDFEVIAIGGDKDLGVVATVGEDRKHVTRGEVFAFDGRSGVGEAFELRCRDRVEVNHAHVGESGTAPGV